MGSRQNIVGGSLSTSIIIVMQYSGVQFDIGAKWVGVMLWEYVIFMAFLCRNTTSRGNATVDSEIKNTRCNIVNFIWIYSANFLKPSI